MAISCFYDDKDAYEGNENNLPRIHEENSSLESMHKHTILKIAA